MPFSSVGEKPKEEGSQYIIPYMGQKLESFGACSWTSNFTWLLVLLEPHCCGSLLVQTAVRSGLMRSSNHGRTVMARNVTLQLQCPSFASDSLAVSNYYVIAVCILSDRACTHWKRGVACCTIAKCVWMTPNVGTLEHLSAFEFLSGRWVCALASISNSLSGKSATSSLISFRIFAFISYIYSPVWFGQIRCDAHSSSHPPLTDCCVAAAAVPGFSPSFGNGGLIADLSVNHSR